MSDKITRIMVVDGSSVSRTLLTRMLCDEITEVHIVPSKSGTEAFELLSSLRFDLVTTALMLPDMDGLELCRRIRKSQHHNFVPIIIVSGDADARLLREGFEAGVTDYFDKSLGYKAFGSFIRAFIQRNSGLVGHILFVEDSATAAAVTSKMLEKQGLKVTHTDSAEKGLALLTQENTDPDNPEGFDLVITDFYLMGDLTGGDLLHAIRAKLHHPQQELPVLVLTSTDDHQTQLEVFHAGANDFVSKPIVEEILIARIRSLLLIKHQYDALKQQAETMRWVAATDSLTGVRSKRYLLDNGEDFIQAPENQPVWAMILDIDHFKVINDTMGHITGDHVLAELGAKFNLSFPDAMVIRFGGEEFCMLIPNSSAEHVLERAETLRREVEELRPTGITVNISIGLVSKADHPNCNLTRLLALADQAMYHAKTKGRNRISVYTKEGPQNSPWCDLEPAI